MPARSVAISSGRNSCADAHRAVALKLLDERGVNHAGKRLA